MSKFQKILVVVAGVLVIAGAGAYVFFNMRGEGAPVGEGAPIFGGIFGGEEAPAQGVGGAPSEEGASEEPAEEESAIIRERLLLIHQAPVAGGVLFEKKGAGVFARYMERGLGHVYETNMATRAEEKIGNETRTAIHEALWSIDGARAFIRFFDAPAQIIRTFAVTQGKTGGDVMQDNIAYMSVSPADATKAFYLLAGTSGGTGIVYDAATKVRRQVFSSPFSEWLSQWVNKNTILLASKPAAGVPGVAYLLNSDTERADKILDNVAGLTALASPSGKLVLYAEGGDETITPFILDIAGDKSIFLPFKTLPEKCAWERDSSAIVCFVPQSIPRENYPDAWYQGKVSFSDELWRLDVGSLETELLAGFSGAAESGIDGIPLSTSPDGEYLLFQNKKDMSLWSFRLSDV